MSRRMQDETTIREVMYPEIDWQTYNWLKDFNLETLTGDDKKRYDDFVMKYVRIGGFTMTELDKSNYPVPSRYDLVYWHYKDANSPYRAVFQAVYHSEYQGSIQDVRSVIFDFDGTDYATSFNSTGAKPFAPLLYTNTFSITNNKSLDTIASFTLNFSITQNKYNAANTDERLPFCHYYQLRKCLGLCIQDLRQFWQKTTIESAQKQPKAQKSQADFAENHLCHLARYKQ